MPLVNLQNNFTAFNLEDLYNKFENQYKHNFSSACMPILSLEDILSEAQLNKLSTELLKSKLDYSSEFGSLALRQGLVRNLYPTLNENNFLATTGASEAIYLVMKSLFSKGDQIIVQKPIYQSLFQIAQDAGCKIIEWQVDLKSNSWDINELKNLLKLNPSVKALVINNPNNPIGTAFEKTQLENIINSLGNRLLISDEVFQPLSLNACPSVCSLYKNAVSICDLSKSFSLPGLRLGWIACTDKNLLDKFSALKNYLSLRTNTLSEIITPYVLDSHNKILEKNKGILRKNIDKLFSKKQSDLFFELKIKKEQISGLCIFPKLKEGYLELNTQKLIEDKSVFLAFGTSFAEEYRDYCRIGLGIMPDSSML